MMWLLVLVLVGLLRGVSAEAESLIPPFLASNALFLGPVHFNHSLEGPLHGSAYSPSSPPYFEISQWNNPAPLPHPAVIPTRGTDTPCSLADPQWFIADSSARVCLGPNHQLELAQNGDSVPCGKEFDLFVSPIGKNYPDFPQAIHDSAPLTQLSALNVSVNAALRYSAVTPRCGQNPQCGGGGKVDYSYGVIGVVFSNAKAKQTIFYQVLLYDTRTPDHVACGAVDKCTTPFRNWYFKTNPFGVSDSTASFQASCLSSGSSVSYNLDLLPKITSAIAEPPTGSDLDTTLSNWAASGIYIGTGLQGSAASTLTISSFNFTQTLK